MAKMNGVQLKTIKEFVGREGYGFSANIYVDNKKVGSVTDSAYGGCYDYFYSNKDAKALVSSRIKEYYTKNKIVDTFAMIDFTMEEFVKAKNNLPVINPEEKLEVEDHFFYELLTLSNEEKYYKKVVKKGHPIIVELDTYDMYDMARPQPITFSCTERYNYQKDIDEFVSKYPNGYATVYKSLDDFNK